jgi:superfamily II DNA or RNA helicase
MPVLRQYQRDAANAVWKGFKEHRKQLAVLPTGSGKTVIFARMVMHEALQPALILAHRDELVSQATDKVREAISVVPGIEKAHRSCHLEKPPIVIGSVQSLANLDRLAKWDPDYFKFIVVDEAHHALSKSWQTVLDHFPAAKVLGVTATPHRGDKRNLGKYFDNLAYEISLLDLVKQGFLAPIKVRTVPLKIDLSTLPKKAGDFSEAESGALLEPMLEQIGKTIQEFAADRKTLIFLPLRQTSRKLCSVLQGLGLKAEHVDGDDLDRAKKLKDFKDGKITHLCNAMLLTEGYDEPSIECIIPLRPTASQPLYAQMVGRGTRIFPGKDYLLLLDYLWLHEKHSLIRPAHLIASTTGIADAMTERFEDAGSDSLYDHGALDLADVHDSALHEREETLRRELEKKASKKSKLVDALEYALDIGSVALADYEPEMPWESEPPTEKQKKLLSTLGIKPESITSKGHATKIMLTVFNRGKMHLATAKQVYWLTKMKHPSPHTATESEASSFLEKRFGGKR